MWLLHSSTWQVLPGPDVSHENTKHLFQTEFHLFLVINVESRQILLLNLCIWHKANLEFKTAFVLLKPLLTTVLKMRGGLSVKSYYRNCGAIQLYLPNNWTTIGPETTAFLPWRQSAVIFIINILKHGVNLSLGKR